MTDYDRGRRDALEAVKTAIELNLVPVIPTVSLVADLVAGAPSSGPLIKSTLSMVNGEIDDLLSELY